MKKNIRKLMIIFIWIVLWQVAAGAIQNDIIFVGPWETMQALTFQFISGDFWLTILSSFLRISLGFLTAFFSGILMGAAASRLSLLREFLEPVTGLLQSVPVASFVILALIWIGSRNLAILVTFLVVFPIIYRNVLEGIRQTDSKMMEMAQIFRLSLWKKILYLYRPALLPYLRTGCKISLGMAWKSGIAAEVIGVPAHSIGEKLYMAKIYLSTGELFAWTFVIIVVSKLFEQIFLWILDLSVKDLNDSNSSRNTSVKTGSEMLSFMRTIPETTHALQISNLQKSYEHQRIFANLSLVLDPGGIYCLLAPSGRGKTTLLRLIMNLEKEDGGSITGANQQPISTVFQEDRLFEMLTPVKNVQLVCDKSVSSSDIHHLLEEFLDAEVLNKPVLQLSGGMKRRVTIARALASPSSFLIMDEPFTGLDEPTRDRTIQLILKYRGNRTLLLVTHQEEDVKKLEGKIIRL